MAKEKPKSYCDLEIWKMAHELAVAVHKMTLEKLPKFEMYEEGNQVRRSSKSISSNIAEGFGRKRYKNEYIKFLTYALASCDETHEHLELLFETGSLTDTRLFENLFERYDILGRKINKFLQKIIYDYQPPKDLVAQQFLYDEDE
ncbi:MAG: four helix bundle protein [bacterium]